MIQHLPHSSAHRKSTDPEVHAPLAFSDEWTPAYQSHSPIQKEKEFPEATHGESYMHSSH